MSKVVFRRGILISDHHVILKVEQVGLSYHLTADSHELLDTYYGRVYRKDVVELINNYNKLARNDLPISLDEDDRILNLILSNLELVENIAAFPQEIKNREGTKSIICKSNGTLMNSI